MKRTVEGAVFCDFRSLTNNVFSMATKDERLTPVLFPELLIFLASTNRVKTTAFGANYVSIIR